MSIDLTDEEKADTVESLKLKVSMLLKSRDEIEAQIKKVETLISKFSFKATRSGLERILSEPLFDTSEIATSTSPAGRRPKGESKKMILSLVSHPDYVPMNAKGIATKTGSTYATTLRVLNQLAQENEVALKSDSTWFRVLDFGFPDKKQGE